MQEFNSLLNDESIFSPNWILSCLYLLSICFFFQIQDNFLSSLGQRLSGFLPELSIASQFVLLKRMILCQVMFLNFSRSVNEY